MNMKIIVCVDINKGMMFHQRRQSQDRVLREKILKITDCLYMNTYSSLLWKNHHLEMIVDDHFLRKAKDDDYCFVENESLKEYQDDIDEIILFCWNKEYPADFYLDINFNEFQLVSQEDFIGSSHDSITQMIYRKE